MRFGFASSPPTVGMELEWHFLHAEDGTLADAGLSVVSSFSEDPHIKPELLQCTVETTAGPGRSVRDLRQPLLARVSRVRRRCEELGLRLCGTGTHGLASGLREVTPSERYLRVSRTGMFMSRRLQATCSLHVHVGMPSLEETLRVMFTLRGVVPALLALSSSSPFWDGHDTGFSSFRQRLLAMTPNYGPAPEMRAGGDFRRVMDVVERAGIGFEFRDVHWDLRPRPDYGTLELRICDAQPTIEASLALAALVHCLMVAVLEHDPVVLGHLPCPLPPWLERENAFRASRYGLDAELLVDDDGEVIAAKELLTALVTALVPVGIRLDVGDLLYALTATLRDGSWAERARTHFVTTRDLAMTMQWLADQLDEELRQWQGEPWHPSWGPPL
ncbi:MAG: carboxylate-amine ligase [Myxococcota bacterium]